MCDVGRLEAYLLLVGDCVLRVGSHLGYSLPGAKLAHINPHLVAHRKASSSSAHLYNSSRRIESECFLEQNGKGALTLLG
jgi:hypothetical protein